MTVGQYAFDKLGWLQFEQLAAELLELEAERRPDDCSPATEEPTLRALDCIARLAPEYRSVPQTVARQLRRSAVERGDAPLLRPARRYQRARPAAPLLERVGYRR